MHSHVDCLRNQEKSHAGFSPTHAAETGDYCHIFILFITKKMTHNYTSSQVILFNVGGHIFTSKMFKSPGFIAFQRFVGNVNEYQYSKKNITITLKCTYVHLYKLYWSASMSCIKLKLPNHFKILCWCNFERALSI